MSFGYIIAGSIVLFALQLLIVMYLVPAAKEKKKKSHKPEAAPLVDDKKWQEAVVKLERQSQSLRQEIAQLKQHGVKLEKELLLEKVKAEKLQEKLNQEKDWVEKEGLAVDKKTKELQQAHKELKALQEGSSKEHMTILRLESVLKEAKESLEKANEQRRALELDLVQTHAKFEAARSENTQLRGKNVELSKKQEDTQWIAKSEYDKVVKELQEKNKTLERIKREG